MSTLRLLVADDSESDVELMVATLERNGHAVSCVRVETAADLERALQDASIECVLADHKMPRGFSSHDVLRIVGEKRPMLPVIVVSGILGEEDAVAAMRAGARDYLLKSNLVRLSAAVEREIRDAVVRREKAALEMQLPDLYRQAQEGIRARDEFLSVAAHELRTPLSAVSLHLQGMSRRWSRQPLHQLDQARERAALDSAIEQCGRLGRLMDNLLSATRIKAGVYDFKPETIDLAALVHSAVTALQTTAERERSALLIEHIDAVFVEWDRQLLERCVENMLLNAIRHSEQKPVSVYVIQGSPQAELHVRDRGVGMTAAEQTRIFEPFDRAGRSRNMGGLGLGLYIAKATSDQHGGNLHVESTEGQGSTFILQLPYAKELSR